MKKSTSVHIFSGVTACLILLSACVGGRRGTTSVEPRFAQPYIEDTIRHNGNATTFVGEIERDHPFVVVTAPNNYVDQILGRCSRRQPRNSFTAHLCVGPPLFIVTKDDAVNLGSIIPFDPLSSFKVSISGIGVMAVDFDLFKIEVEKRQKDWQPVSIRCQFAFQEVSLKELRTLARELQKRPHEDPTIGKLEEPYRIKLLNFVFAQKEKISPSDVSASEETTNTAYLMMLFERLISSGVPVSFSRTY